MHLPAALHGALARFARDSQASVFMVLQAGLAALLSTSLAIVLTGMALVAVGTFLAQAIATGHVGRTAKRDKAAASGIYLASYYAGGLVGSFVLGQVFDRVGWPVCVAVLVVALIAAIGLARALRVPAS